ncbi:MAG: pyruvate, phosphate dikinase [Ancalomicrobiaceae bacterium]|nr:pyruvate, phosphate dikinase [Ancalomicrobiaceae bacterium]
MARWVYGFGNGKADGHAQMSDILGGKGANLAEMCRLGLPVPPGFTISTEVCAHFFQHDHSFPPGLSQEIDAALRDVGRSVGRQLGDAAAPLLVAVRSGARTSMPGMMDSVLNVGLNDDIVMALARDGGERFAFDSYRRFIQTYADVVMGVERDELEEILEIYKDDNGYSLDADLSAADWTAVVDLYKARVLDVTGQSFPQDPHAQLWGAIAAVFRSWMNTRAVTYRKLHALPECRGSAVTVQAMVFGNRGATSAAGVAFTRNPSTGEKLLYGEYLPEAQGEDVVAGIRTPHDLTEEACRRTLSEETSLETAMPGPFAQFATICDRLERHFRDMLDVEFTIESGKLWMLQCRTGKRSAKAALKIAADMVAEGLIDQREALARIDPLSLEQLLHPSVDPDAKRHLLATGLPASPGAATGEIVFSAEDAVAAAHAGRATILVRPDTSPEDIHGMYAATGVLTTRGGMTSHAAVVARGMGTPCVSGAGSMRVDSAQDFLIAGTMRLRKGDVITIDGSTGQVLLGRAAMLRPELTGDFATLMGWADSCRRLGVRANADTPADARVARGFGAEGIGLCRTEHMFFEDGRIVAMREMILADSESGRRMALAKLLPMQRADFVELFEIMHGLPVTIRLLDPPLHEFLPKSPADVVDVAAAMGVSAEKLAERTDQLREENPMLGHRGVRLAVSHPEIYEMQARAIFEAAVVAAKAQGTPVVPEIMVPLVGMVEELDLVKALIDRIAAAVGRETGLAVSYRIGTMIELPRAALRAGDIARTAEFFSFGTNDLTQTTYGLSRDDAGGFLAAYSARGIMAEDPFATLDTVGVGEFIRMASKRGRATRHGLKLGICGEHGGDPASIRFCDAVGLDYVSCSPFRVPIARLAAAQAAIGARRGEEAEAI